MKCPACENSLQPTTIDDVTVDVCKNGCGGIWLDAGELRSIRDRSMSEEERRKVAGKYFSEIFDDRLEKMRAESEKQLERARRFAGMFKYICPSYYVQGKQKWGAF